MLVSQGNKILFFGGQCVIKFDQIFLLEYYCVVSLYMICINFILEEKFSLYKDCMGLYFIQLFG